MHNNDLSINFKKFAPEDFIITDNDYEIEVGLYHGGRFFNGKIICKDRALSIINDYDDNIMSTEPIFYHIISPDIEAVSSYDYSEEELLGNEVPIFDADHIPEMLDSMKRTKKCDRNRPYNGQPHTIEGIRGSHIVVGLTDRDICDCAALALMIAAPGNSDHYAMADKWTNDMTQPAEWSWEDLYSLDLTYMDPVAFLQNLSCHLEMYQGIFPNLAKGLSNTLFNNSDITKEKPEPPKNILIMEGTTLQPIMRKEEIMFIIVDIDGTIADCRHRLHFIKGENKDWDSFFKACKDDKPIQDVLDIINNLALYYNLLFITGRSDVCKGETKYWLGERILVNGYTILMRKQGDFRPDDVVKPELLNNFLEESKLGKDVIQMVFEDRNSIVKKWREMGLTVAQVAEGDF